MFVSDSRTVIQQLINAGLLPPAIARPLDLAPTTVAYHVSRLAEVPPAAPDVMAAPEEGPAPVPTRRLVAELLDSGYTRAEVARTLGVSKATVSYHARRLGAVIDDRCARRYDWEAVQRYYDAGHGVRACISTFGFSAASWAAAVRRGAVVARPAATPIEDLLVADTYRGRHYLKARLLRDGLKDDRCERCGIADWRGQR